MIRALGVAVVLSVSLWSQGQALSLSESVTVIAEKGAKGVPSASQLGEALARAVEILHLDTARLPHLVFIFADQKTAVLEQLPDAGIIIIQPPSKPYPGVQAYPARGVYHIWITVKPTVGSVAQGVVGALNAEFALGINQEGVKSVAEQVAVRTKYLVPVKAWRARR